MTRVSSRVRAGRAARRTLVLGSGVALLAGCQFGNGRRNAHFLRDHAGNRVLATAAKNSVKQTHNIDSRCGSRIMGAICYWSKALIRDQAALGADWRTPSSTYSANCSKFATNLPTNSCAVRS
mgnify:CR=1 FL=1